MRIVLAVALTSCASSQHGATIVALRDACNDHQYWNGHACVAAGDPQPQIAEAAKALGAQDPDAAKAAIAAAEQHGPLDHVANVKLWEQRGMASAFADDEHGAIAAFDMMLALDPSHILSYRLTPKSTLPFEDARKQAAPPPELDVNWPRGQKVGDPMPLDISVVADPKQFLHHATVFVRTRGERGWHAADLALGGIGDRRVVLPPVHADKPLSLEVYLRAYDAHDNEVLTWADPTRPREIPLRYEAPTPWYRTWWVLALAGGTLAIATGVTVYELTIAPPSTIGGGVMVK